MHTKVFEGIDAVDQAQWDRLTARHPFAGWTWCKYGEIAAAQPTYYAIICDGDDPIGGAIYTIMHDEDAPTTNRLVQGFLTFYLRRRPLVVCRTPIATIHRGFFVPDDPAQRAHVLAEIRRVAQDLLKKYHGSFFLADYVTADELNYDWGDFRKIRDFANIGMLLTVEWDTWDDFLADLKERNKKAHKNVRHNIRYAEEADVTIQITHETPPIERVIDLVVTKMQHYDVAFEPKIVRGIVSGLSALQPEQYVWITAHHEGRMVGCELVFNDPVARTCKPTLYGRDYDVEYVYFAMSYADIRYAIETLHAKTVIYDTEAYDFKRRMGMVEDSRNNLVLTAGSHVERGLVNVLMRFIDD